MLFGVLHDPSQEPCAETDVRSGGEEELGVLATRRHHDGPHAEPYLDLLNPKDPSYLSRYRDAKLGARREQTNSLSSVSETVLSETILNDGLGKLRAWEIDRKGKFPKSA